MPTPLQMFDHALDFLKGWFSPYALDISGKLHADVTVDPLYAGRVVHVASVDSDAKTLRFKPGANGKSVSIFLINGTDHLDVNNAGGNHWTPVAPAGYLSGLVSLGGFELETTEFDTTLTYLPNEYLRSVRSDSSSTAGTLTNASTTLGTTLLCGQVSRGKRTNHHGKSVLAFWTNHIPGSEATT